MSFLKKIVNKLRRVKVQAEQMIVLPPSEKLGYFNGACPYCKEHIGVYVWLEWYREGLKKKSRKAAYCPVCGKEIFGKIEKWEEGRI